MKNIDNWENLNNRKTIQNQLNMRSKLILLRFIKIFQNSFNEKQREFIKKIAYSKTFVIIDKATDESREYFNQFRDLDKLSDDIFSYNEEKMLVNIDIDFFLSMNYKEIIKYIEENLLAHEIVSFFINTNQNIKNNELTEYYKYINDGFILYYINKIEKNFSLKLLNDEVTVDSIILNIIDDLTLLLGEEETKKIILNEYIEDILNKIDHEKYYQKYLSDLNGSPLDKSFVK